jgi:hypothetical protein
MFFPEIASGAGAMIGFFAATRPDTYPRYFLAEWQRRRLDGLIPRIDEHWLVRRSSSCADFGVIFDCRMKIATRLLNAVRFRCLSARGTLVTVQKALPLFNVFAELTNRTVSLR